MCAPSSFWRAQEIASAVPEPMQRDEEDDGGQQQQQWEPPAQEEHNGAEICRKLADAIDVQVLRLASAAARHLLDRP